MNAFMEKQPDQYNYTIAFMKAFFSFCVVCRHYWEGGGSTLPEQAFWRMCNSAVPVFMILSFYLTSKDYLNIADWGKRRKRLGRLLIPYVSWAFIHYFGYLAGYYLFKLAGREDSFHIEFSIKDLFWQLAFGCDEYLCAQLWYLFDLIVITVLLWMVSCKREYTIRIALLLGVLAVAVQYFGINLAVFGGLPYEARYSMGRLAEMIPFACGGLVIGGIGVYDRLSAHRWYVFTLLVFLLTLISNCDVFVLIEGFSYQGLFMLSYSFFLFLVFDMLPMNSLNSVIKKIIKFLSKYSLGVFCVHVGVGTLWYGMEKAVAPGLGMIGLFTKSVIIYLISVAVSWTVGVIPLKWTDKLVE